MHTFWQVFYWSSMLLSYIVVPWMMNFECCGEFNTIQRIKQSGKDTLWLYFYYACAGFIFLLFLWYRGSFSVTENTEKFTLKGFLMALGGAAGLLQIIIFLGYGLISVPRNVFFRSNAQSQFDMTLC